MRISKIIVDRGEYELNATYLNGASLAQTLNEKDNEIILKLQCYLIMQPCTYM